MSSWLEIIIPVRNSDSRLLETAESLVAQTARGFGVLLCDHMADRGPDVITQSSAMLTAAGIPVRRVPPPCDLPRVAHWNWAHAQGESDWLKPLSAGDRLKPTYVERVGERARWPGTHLVLSGLAFRVGRRPIETACPFTMERLEPADFLKYFPAHDHWIGATANVAYSRDAWQAVGGYPLHLPTRGAYKLVALLALRFGVEVIHESLAECSLASGGFGAKVHGGVETWLALRQLRNYCLSVDLPWPAGGEFRAILRQFQIDDAQALSRPV